MNRQRVFCLAVAMAAALVSQVEQAVAQDTVQFARVVEAGGVHDNDWDGPNRMLVIMEVKGQGTTTLPEACGLGTDPLPNALALVIQELEPAKSCCRRIAETGAG